MIQVFPVYLFAYQDLKESLLLYRVWLHLGWVEVKQRYRRSVIGPWWITLSMFIFIFAMSIVFSRLFNQSLEEYIPFFTAGYLVWTLISTTILESAEIFRSNSGYIKQIKLPLNLYIFKHLVKQTIFLLHNAVVYLFVCLYFGVNPGSALLLALPGYLLLMANLYWISLLTALICSRYRDMVPIITSGMQIVFFITPITWMPRLLEHTSRILKYNPFVYFLETVRSPLLGALPSPTSFIVSGCTAMAGIAISFFIFSIFRPRIAFWVD